jgi:hypothetical protein
MWRGTVKANELDFGAGPTASSALVNVGPANPREFAEVTSTTEVLSHSRARPEARAAAERRNFVAMPRVVAMRSSDTYRGDDWIGLKLREASVVRGTRAARVRRIARSCCWSAA